MKTVRYVTDSNQMIIWWRKNMRTKNVLMIVIVALICILAVGAGLYFLQGQSYKIITMNSIEIEVPNVNTTVNNQTSHYSVYNDSSNDIFIQIFDSEGSGISDFSEAATFATLREAYQIGAQLQQKDNMSYNYSSSLKHYTYLYNYTHKNVFIVTGSEDDMQHIIKTMHLTNSTLNTTGNQTVNNSVTSTKTTVASTAKKSSSSQSVNKDEDPYTYGYEENGDYYRSNKNTGKKEYYFDGDGGGDGDWVENY